MEEAVVISIFALIMIYIEIKDSKKIVIRSRRNYVRMTMAIIVATASTIIFWPKSLSQQYELVLIAILILFYGFVPEGLAKDKVVKTGTLDGDYNRYQKIELEPEDKHGKFTRISFFVRKNNSTSLVVQGCVDGISDFIKSDIKDTEKVQFRKRGYK